jgi:hypothetical protein
VPLRELDEGFFRRDQGERQLRARHLETEHVERRLHLDQPSGSAARHVVDPLGPEPQPSRDAPGGFRRVLGRFDGEFGDHRRVRGVLAEAGLERGRQLLADFGVFRRHPRELEERLDPLFAALVVEVRQKAQQLDGDVPLALLLDGGRHGEEDRKLSRVLLHALGPERFERIELLSFDELEELGRDGCGGRRRDSGHGPLIVA